MRKTTFVIMALLVIALSCFSMGCSKEKEVAGNPLLAPPLIGKAGVLRAGVLLGNAPYGVKQGSKYVGYDVEIAQALADKLHLTCEFVTITPDTYVNALEDGMCDIVLSVTKDSEGKVLINNYQKRYVAFYQSGETTPPAETIAEAPVAVQKKSVAFWTLKSGSDEIKVMEYDSVADGITALTKGNTKSIAGDSIVLQYAKASGERIVEVNTLVASDQCIPTDIGLATLSSNKKLSKQIKKLFKELVDAKIIAGITEKWLGSQN